MFGVASLFKLDWLPLIFPLSLIVLHFGIIKREERYLERKFGAMRPAYRAISASFCHQLSEEFTQR